MPKALEDKLTKEAANKGLRGARAKAYVYGTMRNSGWKPGKDSSSGLPPNWKGPGKPDRGGNQEGE